MIGRPAWFVFAALAALGLIALPCLALEPDKDEWDKLKACEESVCDIILKKEPAGKPLVCNVNKTWAKSTIKQGESSMLTWAFGDTRCETNLKLDRAEIIAALSQPKYTLQSPTQTVKCIVMQDGKPQPVKAMAAPKMKFKDGNADKIWIKLEKIEGPESVTGTISTIAAMEDKLGIFHKSMIKQVNKFIHKRCAEKYGPEAKAAEAAAAKAEKIAKAKKETSTTTGDKPDAAKPATKSETEKAKGTP